MSHAEYCAKCDEDQLRSLIEHANARLKVLEQAGWVPLWTVSIGWANIAWFAEDDYAAAVVAALDAATKEAERRPNKEIEMEVRLVNNRPEEAERLIKETQRAAHQPQPAHDGGDGLPPLPAPCDYCASKGIYAFTAQHMRDYARAAVFAALAGQKAEQVYQVRSIIAPDAWCDIDNGHAEFCKTHGYDVRTLYRAAPPQQVDAKAPTLADCWRYGSATIINGETREMTFGGPGIPDGDYTLLALAGERIDLVLKFAPGKPVDTSSSYYAPGDTSGLP